MPSSNKVSLRNKKRNNPKKSKFQKRVSWLARFILRIDPSVIQHLHCDMETDELLKTLIPLFDEKLLSNVDNNYKSFCKQIIQNKASYIKFLSQLRKKSFTEALLKEIKFEEQESNKRKRRKRRKSYLSLTDKILTLTNNHKHVLDASREATSMNDIADVINRDFITQYQNDAYQQIILFDLGGKHENHNTVLKQIFEVLEVDFKIFQNILIKTFEKEISKKNRVKEIFEKVDPEIKRIQDKKNVMIDIVELVNFEKEFWGIKIYINEKGYLFDFSAKNYHNILEVIEGVVEDYLFNISNKT
ncbi:MAG: hypothetical protein ACXADY_02995 [Candidatus Hodarchaeales archaeon]|jgi:hypothetical protein